MKTNKDLWVTKSYGLAKSTKETCTTKHIEKLYMWKSEKKIEEILCSNIM